MHTKVFDWCIRNANRIYVLNCKVSILLLCTAAIVGSFNRSLLSQELQEQYGAECNPTGDAIGGGSGYSHAIREADIDVVVNHKTELLAALKDAKAETVVYVADDSEIDLTGVQEIVIPAGVTLASGRGRGKSKGGMLFTTDDKRTHGKSERFSLFVTGGPDVRVTGLRLKGPDAESRGRYEYLNSDGILGRHDSLEVDNCEIWAWSHGGVYAREGEDVHVHHNFIHHCQRRGLGYCVVLNKAMVLIEANHFDHYRHAIAGTGRSPSGYEARFNISGPNAIGHVFDMHGGADRKDGTNIAGDVISIHHNTFQSKRTDFVIRGVPTKSCEIHHNWFVTKSTPGKAVVQKNAKGKVNTFSNAFGRDKEVK